MPADDKNVHIPPINALPMVLLANMTFLEQKKGEITQYKTNNIIYEQL